MATYSGGEREKDYGESAIRSVDRYVKRRTGSSLLHWGTLAAVGASIGLYLAGKKQAAIFVGLWAPTFQALRANARWEEK